MSSSVLTVRITGVAPLVMHNGGMADPLYPIARELERYTAKRKKSEADHHRIADLEFCGGLWLDDGRPCLPAQALEASICQSAARRRAKALYRGAVMVKANAHLVYDGPRDIEALKAESTFRLRVPVAINGRRLIRTRPMFPQWSVIVDIGFLPSLVNRADLIDVLIGAGDVVGVGDHRPRYGRFTVSPIDDADPTFPDSAARHG